MDGATRVEPGMAISEDAAASQTPGAAQGRYAVRSSPPLWANGIRNGVNLKLLSLCMGHVRTQMTEHYIMEAGLTAQVQEAALQVAYGQRVVAQ